MRLIARIVIFSTLVVICTEILAQKVSESVSFDIDSKTHIITDVYVDGKGPVKLMIDTGTSVTFLTPNAFTQLVIAGGKHKLKFGAVEVPDVNLVNSPISMHQGVDGMVGWDVLRNFIVTIDFTAKKLYFTKKENYKKPDKAETVKFTKMMNGAIVLTVSIDGKDPVLMWYDTGTPDNIYLLPDVAQNFGLSGSGKQKVKEFKLGSEGVKFSNVEVNVYESAIARNAIRSLGGKPVGTIGTPFFYSYSVGIDYFNNELILVKKK